MNILELLDKVETLQNVLIAQVRGSNDTAIQNNPEYRELRNELIQHEEISILLPRFVRTCRDLRQFWSYIKSSYAHYDERERFVREQFAPLLDKLEGDVTLNRHTLIDKSVISHPPDTPQIPTPVHENSFKQSRIELREKISQLFDASEIKTMCFDLSIDYDSLSGDNKADKVRELVGFCERHHRVGDLVNYCQKHRVGVQW